MFYPVSCPEHEKGDKNGIELHAHTTASDGYYTSGQLVCLACRQGIKYLAITDHDTTAGIAQALACGRQHSLEVIPGIELSTMHNHHEIHILGYYIDETSPQMRETLQVLTTARLDRARKIVTKLNSLGYPLRYEEVKRKATTTGSIGRPHIALALIDHGIVTSIEEAFQKLLNPGCPGYVPRFRLTPFEAIDLVREAGGVPVLAHPGVDFPAGILSTFVEAGLKGIEVFHPEHTQEVEEYYLQQARKMDLIITGGSDFHGHDACDLSYFGNMAVPEISIQHLKNQARSV